MKSIQQVIVTSWADMKEHLLYNLINRPSRSSNIQSIIEMSLYLLFGIRRKQSDQKVPMLVMKKKFTSDWCILWLVLRINALFLPNLQKKNELISVSRDDVYFCSLIFLFSCKSKSCNCILLPPLHEWTYIWTSNKIF